MRPGFLVGLITTVTLLARAASGSPTHPAEDEILAGHATSPYAGDLQEVLERRFLRVVTSDNAFDYYIYQGQPTGFQFEMVRSFTAHLNSKYPPSPGEPPIQFELLPVRSEALIPMLEAGHADMIAARLTITPDRSGRVLFSKAYRRVDERLVAHSEAPAIRSVVELSGKRIAVRPESSHYETLQELNGKLVTSGHPPVLIPGIDPALESEAILALVSEGHFDYTLVDSLIAEAAVAVLPDLRLEPGPILRRDGELAWATRPEAKNLSQELSAFLEGYKHGSLLGNVGVRRYFGNHQRLKRRLIDGRADGLSPYDTHFREFGERYGFDWRLLAAVAYQESRFDPSAKNRWGATGLFQIKPATAAEPYIGIPEIEGPANAANNVHAGAKYLAWIKQRYFDSVSEMRERDRIRMALAAYNAGPRTILRARERAAEMGLDSTRWFRNVELALLSMNKSEPVKYVSEINQRYLSYTMLGIE